MLFRTRRAFLTCLTAASFVTAGAGVSRAEDVVYFHTAPLPFYDTDTVVCTGKPLPLAETACDATEYAVQQVVVIPGYTNPGGPHPYLTEVILYGRSSPLPAGTRLVNPVWVNEEFPEPCLPLADPERWPEFPAGDLQGLIQGGFIWHAQID